MRTENDADARRLIREDIDTNYFVEAGAGSGKTTVLVDRMVTMVMQGREIEKICAITFTKAASEEFYARFRARLSEELGKSAPDSPEHGRLEYALKNVDLCFMGTIDSFCQTLLSEHPIAAGIPSDAVVISNEERSAEYRSILSRIRQGEFGEELQEKSRLFFAYFNSPERAFTENVDWFLSTRNAELRKHPFPGREPDDFFADEKQRLLPMLRYLAAPEHESAVLKGLTKSGGPNPSAVSYQALRNNLAQLEASWENLQSIRSALKQLEKLRLEPSFAVDTFGLPWTSLFSAHTGKKGEVEWYEIVQDGCEDPLAIGKISAYLIAAAENFLEPAAQTIAEDLKKRGCLDFFDYLLYCRDLLKKDAAGDGALIRHIYDRHSYFLIDEFQDTNPLQAEVFFYLTAAEPEEDWRRCVPRPGSLFIVGDPKQSIYRFRHADIRSYTAVKKLFAGEVGSVLLLTRNFRSTDKLSEWFNGVFDELITDRGGCEYMPIPANGRDNEGTLNGAYFYRQLSAEKSEPKRMARLIHDLTDSVSGRTILPPKEEKARPLRYGDFMIITPSKNRLRDYMAEMDALGIPYRVEGTERFDECPALRAVWALMSAAADKGNAPAVKLLGIDLTEERRLAYAEAGRKLPPSALFELLLDREELLSRMGTENADYLYYSLELLRSAEVSGEVVSLRDAVEYIGKQFSRETDNERCLHLIPEDNEVLLANVHKVKGLERNVVIMASPEGKSHDAESRVDYSGETPVRFVFSVSGMADGTYQAEYEEEKKLLEQENIRLLYVAATRAACALIVADNETKPKKKSEKWGGPVEGLWKPLFDREAGRAFFTDADELTVSTDEISAETRLTPEAAAERPESVLGKMNVGLSYTVTAPSSLAKNVYAGENSPEEPEDGGTPPETADPAVKSTVLGTLVHRMMELLVTGSGERDKEALLSAILREYGAGEAYAPYLRRAWERIVENGGCEQSSGAPKDVLAELSGADEVYCELPFCCPGEHEGEILRGVIDVLYRKGERWRVVDYKSNADETKLAEEYEAQLNAYRIAVRNTLGVEAEAVLYHIDVR